MDKKMEKKLNEMMEQIKKEYNNKLADEKKKLLDKIITIYPELAKEKDQIEDKLMENAKEIYKLPSKEIVLEEIKINDTVYYKDVAGGIWDDKCKSVGITDEDGKYILFEDNKINRNINHNINLH